MHPGLRVGVLGDLEVAVDGHPVAVGGAVPRALLVRLVLARGATVVDTALHEDLWDGAPPPSAAGTTQAHVSRLRRALLPAGSAAAADQQPLVRRGPGYALVLDDDAVDAQRFERLAAEGRAALAEHPGRAARVLAEALALWRGPALADVAHRTWAAPEAERLGQLLLSAREDAVQAQLALGHDAEAAGAAASLTAEHPLRERGWELLALALYRQGRQADALGRLAELRSLLQAELGADPGPGVQELFRRLLAHDPALLLPRPAAGSGTGSQAAVSPAAPAVPGRPEPAAPPVRSTNLPLPASPLVGRAAELDEVGRLLAEHRLVTLTGPGGTGKTRLALEVARRRADEDGPWLVALGPVEAAGPGGGPDGGSPALRALAAALGLATPLTGVRAADTASVARVLAEREVLVVLDDCEHLLDDVAPLAEDLLHACPRLRLLVTSREALRAEGERTYEVPQLSAGVDGDAVRLFLARAEVTAPGWRPTPEELRGVDRLCAALDGLPLALELSAAQLRALTLADLLGLLDDHQALLRGGRRGDTRRTTMQGTIAWSYDRLGPAEADVLTALSVFAGSFDLEAAREVLGRPDVVPVLADLVARSLVSVSPPGAPRRFWLLGVVRSFAAARLDPGRRAELVGRHTAWVLRMAEAAPPDLRGLAGTPAMARLVDVAADVDAALAAASPGDAVRIGTGAHWSLYAIPSRTAASAARLRAGLEALDADPALDPGVGEALRSYGWTCVSLFARLLGDPAGSVAALDRAEVLAGASGDPRARARVMTNRAFWLAMADDDGEGARAEATAALAVAAAARSGVIEADALLALGVADLRSGLARRAVEHLERCAALADAHGTPSVALAARQLQAKAELAAGRTRAALRAAAEFGERAWRLGEALAWVSALCEVAGVLVHAGRPLDAAVLLAAAEAQGARIGASPRLFDPDVARTAQEVELRLGPPERDASAARGAAVPPEQQLALLRAVVADAS
ncbi:AfsR/SARP family transcriptional regulator [Streptomyces sp. NP160]|uniref:AfsR/SARP family transcriptional regulator n=1 Tax=Streptomyces sp. NP160 TaxID=2586637 RepID=UPI001119186E|nr:AfsR/SARP family transcriptional regulator [Streptomyces sp. NP160]TNM68046.1 AfsR/SARP family transcriptional regulator [Streptomyces sp. NP160]